MKSHDPLPWIVVRVPRVVGGDLYRVVSNGGKSVGTLMSKENAELIVQAVNYFWKNPPKESQ